MIVESIANGKKTPKGWHCKLLLTQKFVRLLWESNLAKSKVLRTPNNGRSSINAPQDPCSRSLVLRGWVCKLCIGASGQGWRGMGLSFLRKPARSPLIYYTLGGPVCPLAIEVRNVCLQAGGWPKNLRGYYEKLTNSTAIFWEINQRQKYLSPYLFNSRRAFLLLKNFSISTAKNTIEDTPIVIPSSSNDNGWVLKKVLNSGT